MSERQRGDIPPDGTLDAAPTPLRGEQFEAFYRREYRLVVALAYSLSGNRTAAEDLAQEAMAQAYRDWDRITAMEYPAAY
jgi:DNA-directed RNA polymerase specialized sigma24 family protein